MATIQKKGLSKADPTRLQRVEDVLHAAHYRAAAEVQGLNRSTLRFWVGSGRQPVIVVQEYPDNAGLEIWTPLTTAMHMGAVLETLKTAVSPFE